MFPVEMTISTYNYELDENKVFYFVVLFNDEHQHEIYQGDSYDNIPVQDMLDKWHPGYQAQDFPELVDHVRNWSKMSDLPVIDLTTPQVPQRK